MQQGLIKLLYLEFIRNWRQGLFIVYLLVSLGLALLLSLLEPQYFFDIYALVLYSEPSIVGFFFIGGIFYLEAEDGIHETIVLSPRGASVYIAVKLILFGVLAFVAALILGFLPPVINGALSLNPVTVLLLAGITGLNAMLFTSIGIAAASRFKSIMAYAINSIWYLLPMFLPMVFFFIEDLRTFVGFLPGGVELSFALFLENRSEEASSISPAFLILSFILSIGYLVFASLYAKGKMDLRVRNARLSL